MRALITSATGEITRFYQGVRYTYERWAKRQGYQFLEASPNSRGRDAYWIKLVAIRKALEEFDSVVWVDADCYIDARTPDIFAELPEGKWLGAVEHHTTEGAVFNVGVMAVCSCEESRAFFDEAWELGRQYLSHKWPDQAPVMHLLGYSTTIPVSRDRETEYSKRLELLGGEWNALPRFGDIGYINHFAGVPTSARMAQLQVFLHNRRRAS